MKENNISRIMLCALANLTLNSNLMAMDDEPVTAEFNYTQEQQIYRARTIDQLNQIISNTNDPLLLKKVLLVLVEKGWTGRSALKINYLLQQISTLDPNASLIRFDDAQDDIMGYLIQNHRPASMGRSNAYLPDWIAWFVQRGVAVDALSDEKSVSQPGYTPLCWAVYYKRPDVVLRLLQLGAQVSTVNRPKKVKPFTVLERYGNNKDPEIIAIVNLLKEYNSRTDNPADATIQTSNPKPTVPTATTTTSSTAAAANITSPAASKTAVLALPTSTANAHSSSATSTDNLTQEIPAVSTTAATTESFLDNDATEPAVVTPPQPQTVASMLLRPKKLLIAGGIVLALYAGHRWLSAEPTKIENDTQDNLESTVVSQ